MTASWVSHSELGSRFLLPDWLIEKIRNENPSLLDGYSIQPCDMSVPE